MLRRRSRVRKGHVKWRIDRFKMLDGGQIKPHQGDICIKDVREVKDLPIWMFGEK